MKIVIVVQVFGKEVQKMSNKEGKLRCEICGKDKMVTIGFHVRKKHKLSMNKYREMYQDVKIVKIPAHKEAHNKPIKTSLFRRMISKLTGAGV